MASSEKAVAAVRASDMRDIDTFLEDVESFASAADDPILDAADQLPDQDDPQRHWIARGLGRSPYELSCVRGEAEAGEDQGAAFYALVLDDGALMIRADGLRAYLADVSGPSEKLQALLEELGLQQVSVPQQTAAGWISIAEGVAPQAGRCAEIEYLHPGQPQQRLTAEALALRSEEVQTFFRRGELIADRVQHIEALPACPGEVVARVSDAEPGQRGRDVFGRDLDAGVESDDGRLEPGLQVCFDEAAGLYRAEGYGYLCLVEGRLGLLPPLVLSADQLQARWILLGTQARPLTAQMLGQCLKDLGVVAGVLSEELAALVAQVGQGEHQPGAYVIARGTPPRDGRDAQLELLVDLERRAGQVAEDGSIDFREVNFAANVRPGQVLARRTRPTPGVPGQDVLGRVLPARDGQDQPLAAGKNVQLTRDGESEQFAAEIVGAVRRANDEISVSEVLNIKGDICYQTGNLSFDGEICVEGSVLSGFAVKATGDIVISGAVEAGAEVVSRGDVVVGQGILGRRTRVVAQGDVRAQFAQEVTVMAGGAIELGNYAYNARLYAGGGIKVQSGAGKRSGSIMGGQAWAYRGLDLHLGGAPAGPATQLVAGLAKAQAEKLDKLAQRIEEASRHMAVIIERFGMSRIDIGQIRNMIAASTGPRRKILARHAQQLGKLAQFYQKLLEERQQQENQIGTNLEQVAIVVRDKVFPGVEVRIGEYRRQIEEEILSPRFHIRGNALSER